MIYKKSRKKIVRIWDFFLFSTIQPISWIGRTGRTQNKSFLFIQPMFRAIVTNQPCVKIMSNFDKLWKILKPLLKHVFLSN